MKTYFNGGFFVLTPNVSEYKALRHLKVSGRTFAEQDALNDHFHHRWCKLPKQCNWLGHMQNNPGARDDSSVWMVHRQDTEAMERRAALLSV